MGAFTRLGVASLAGVRSVRRHPTTAAMVLLLPPLVIVTFDIALEAIAETPTIQIEPGTGELAGALFATAFLAGLLSVFQVVGTMDADRRLVVAGYRPWEVLGARVLTVLLTVAVVAVVTAVTFWWRTPLSPERPELVVAALLAAGIVYAMVGAIIGLLVGRELEGSLILVFLADFDAFVAIDVVPVDAPGIGYLPLSHPHALLDSAVREGTVAGDDLAVVVGTIIVLAVVAFALALYRGDLE